MSFLKLNLVLREWLHHARFQKATEQPDVTQAQFLQTLVKQNADTVFGRDHGFSTIKNPADYACQVPIQNYEGFRPYINRIVARQERILTTEPPGSRWPASCGCGCFTPFGTTPATSTRRCSPLSVLQLKGRPLVGSPLGQCLVWPTNASPGWSADSTSSPTRLP